MGAAEDWFSPHYGDLKALARHLLSRERDGHTLNPTALVHEAWLRVSCQRQQRPWSTPEDFYPAVVVTMRRVLIDYARKRAAARRPTAGLRLELGQVEAYVEPDTLSLMLSRLEEYDVRLALVLHLRVFAGMTVEETAWHLAAEASEIKRDYAFAKAWLRREIGAI